MKRAFALLIFASLILHNTTQAQLEDFSFYRNSNIPVNTTAPLPQPWSGGMNAVRFFVIDLNFDGINDLVAFEKQGNRILPFLQQNNHYQFAPQYALRFPELHDWMLLYDYNGDHLPDIFTYGLAGISVYKNTSCNGQLAFELQCEQLTAYYYNGYVNIFAAPTDYPIIDDIDQDGHLDILNFWVLGKYVHHLRNYSNNPEVFDFHLENECWGHFSESADDNGITLFSDCDNKNDDENEPLRHTGSTMLLHDFDGNGLPDMLLGDMDFPNLVLLYNHGTLADARMTAQDTVFPSHAPVSLYSMPAASRVQLPGNECASLLIAPADPSLNKSQDIRNVWRYDFDTLLSQYTLTNNSFLQEEMIDVGSGAKPVLFDWSGDGLPDLFIANNGSFDSVTTLGGQHVAHYASAIQYYLNAGTLHLPDFQLQNTDFGRLKALNLHALHPTFGDFDGDGLIDMLCGREDGTLMLIQHQRLVNDTTGTGIIDNYQLIDVGKYSTPQYFDLDEDGFNDLLIGNQRGTISFYRNSGLTGAASFGLVTDTLGGVDVRNFEQSYYGYSVPCFYRDSQHGTVLFCGSESGNIFYYNEIDNNLDGIFSQSVIAEAEDAVCAQCTHLLREGIRSGCAVATMLSDEFPDMLVGNYAGGLSYFAGRTPTQHLVHLPDLQQEEWQVYPNPTADLLHINSPAGTNIYSVRLYDCSGRLLLHTNAEILDLQHFTSGLYLLEINGKTRLKVIVNH